MQELTKKSVEEIPLSFIGAIQTATYETFTKINGQEVVCELQDYDPIEGIFGSISFTGAQAWSLTLGFPRTTAEALGPIFAGVEVPFHDEDMGDMICELTNILAGWVIAELRKENFSAQMAFPTVARGHETGLFVPKGLSSLRLCFNSRAGKFWVKVIVLPSQP